MPFLTTVATVTTLLPHLLDNAHLAVYRINLCFKKRVKKPGHAIWNSLLKMICNGVTIWCLQNTLKTNSETASNGETNLINKTSPNNFSYSYLKHFFFQTDFSNSWHDFLLLHATSGVCFRVCVCFNKLEFILNCFSIFKKDKIHFLKVIVLKM